MLDRINNIWGSRTPFARGETWPVRVDQKLADGLDDTDVDRWVQSACVLCSNGCGCDIAVKDGQMVGIRGRGVDSVNHGRLGPKGLFGSWQGVDNAQRLTKPLIRVDGELVEEAGARVAPGSFVPARPCGSARQGFAAAAFSSGGSRKGSIPPPRAL